MISCCCKPKYICCDNGDFRSPAAELFTWDQTVNNLQITSGSKYKWKQSTLFTFSNHTWTFIPHKPHKFNHHVYVNNIDCPFYSYLYSFSFFFFFQFFLFLSKIKYSWFRFMFQSFTRKSSICYVHKILWKINISYPVIRSSTCIKWMVPDVH